MQESEIHMLSPAAQLQCRAIFALGTEVPRHRAWGGAVVKRTGTHVHLDVQQANKAELSMWSARVEPTAVYATDGTKQICKNEEGKVKFSNITHEPMHTIARAAVRHDGTVVGGAFDERDGANTYVAELAALIEALQTEPDGGRIIIVFYATSPVRAALRYGRVHARRKGCHYAHVLLDTLTQEARRHELVLLIWQRSHVGSPVNEWADIAVDAIAKDCNDPSQGDGVTPLVCAASEAFSLTDERWPRGPFRWSGPAAQRFVLARLRETVRKTELPDAEDLEYGALSGPQRSVLDAVLSRRAQIGDARRYTGKAAQTAAAAAGCPAGCKHTDGTPCKLTYDHAAFYCRHPELAVLRQRWADELLRLRGLVEIDGVPDKPLLNAMRLLRPRQFPTSRNACGVPRGDMCLACDDDEQQAIERELRRVVGGRYHKPSKDAKCSAGTLHATAREAAAAGALVQTVARRL